MSVKFNESRQSSGRGWRLSLLGSVLGISLGFVTALQAQTPAPSTYSAYSGADTKVIPPTPALGTANTFITDPTFGSRILRVTDASTSAGESFLPTDSGFHRSWNADSTAIKLMGSHGDAYWMEFDPNGFKVGDGSSKPVPHAVTFGANWEWSTVDPNIMYFMNGNQIAKYNKATGVTTNLGGPSTGEPLAYSAVVIGQDNWVCAAAGSGVQDSYTKIYCINPISPATSEFIDVYKKTINGVSQGDPNWPTSAAGKVIGIHDISGGTGSKWLEVTFHQASWGGNGGAVLDLGTNTWTKITSADIFWGGHVSMGNGKYANSAGSADGRDSRGVLLRDPDNAMNSASYNFISQPPLTNNNWCDSDHLSWLNSTLNAGAPLLISRYYANTPNCAFAWTGEIYAAAVDGSNTVWRFAHNHDGGCYFGEGFAQISNDGKWALFSSYWDGTLGPDTSLGCTTRIDTFIVDLSVGAAPPAPSIITGSLATGTQNSPYTATLTATGGTAPYTWSITAGSLPAGLTLSATSGTISGTPTGTGTSSLTVQVSDANSQLATASLNLTINAASQPFVITTISLPSGTQNVAYSTAVTVSGGTAPYTWSVVSGSLPAGLTLASSSGTISGTPTASGTSAFTVQVTDANSQKVTVALTVVISSSTAAIKMVQSKSAAGSGAAGISTSFATGNKAGNLIIAFVRMATTSQTVTVTDTAGNAYTEAVSQAQTTDGHQIHIFYAKNVAGMANTVTATFSAANTSSWFSIYEFSGLSTTAPLDQTAHAQGTGLAASSGLTAPTATANELLFGVVGLPGSYAGTLTPAAGYMLLQHTNGTAKAANEGTVINAAGSASGVFTLSSSANWSAAIVTFKR